MSKIGKSPLPSGWKECRIGELFESWGGHTPSKSMPSYWGDGVPWASSKDVKAPRLASTTHTVTPQAVEETGLKVCPVGSVLVVMRSGILAHTLPVTVTDVPVAINQDLKAFHSSEPFMNEWLALFLRMSASALLASSRREGTTVQSIQYPLLKGTLIPVPPEDERAQIIGAVRMAVEKQASALPHVKTAARAIERFRQAVLTAACSGRLTEDWRGVAGVGDWDFERAADVCDKVQSGGTPRSGFTDEPGVPFLKVYNIVSQQVDFGHRPQYVPETVHHRVLKKSVAYPGDVIMNIVGPPLGKVAIIPDDFPEWNLNQAITIFRPGDRILREWLYYYLRSGLFMDADLITRGSAGQSNISLTQCRDLQIPVPTIAEQQVLVQRIGELMDHADSLLARVDTAGRRTERISQAVLVKAFRGELTA
ncbi:restriction endonuclease subunit S [Mycolicibacterium gilvum]|uniref:Restriction endonuclease S subunit n=1 Tax=Mycolicibacterium gilvum (strain DSM 45189 / LMG 24558 / Spyr1) TaxID=278137 RepID=E6TK36_MYCSR|nr:restriction endonuclease subunit S [Mycolicibacterium gilvum]ADT99181.1 restriction endonuclease S subunit [Mycolicibacterium gilvum Spyr1]